MPEREQRRLTTILAADVAGYSRLVGADEEGITRRLRALRVELFDPKITSNRGRVIKTTGDGILIEFASVVDAVRCAIDVQRAMTRHNADFIAEKRIEFRVGIHLGDVIVESDGDLLGDGVNIAARLEGISEPGGICLSEDAYRQVRDKIAPVFVDWGERELKNIVHPVRVYAIAGQNDDAMGAKTGNPGSAARSVDSDFRRGGDNSAWVGSAPLALPDKPSIAVLPFQNMSGDPEQDYFADGMVEDIITGLSRIKWVFVIARNSSFVYKGKAIDVKQVGRELGVSYVLEGSVRKSGNRVRITGQLVKAETGAHLWADKFDGALDDVFDLQDRITASVVGVVEPSLRQAEIERARRKRPDNLDAYDLYLRALPYTESVMPAHARIAMGYLQEALARDPNYPAAHALAAWCHETLFVRGGNDEADRSAGIRHARAAIESGTDDAAVLAVAAVCILHLGHDQRTALSVVERALSLNEACATALYLGAHIAAFCGYPEAAIEYGDRALRLSPFDPVAFEAHNSRGFAMLQREQYSEAAASWAKAIQANPRFSSLYFVYAAALALAGQLDDARIAAKGLLELEPTFRVGSIITALSGALHPIFLPRLSKGARLAGLPE